MNTIELTLPSWMTCPLYYGDLTALSLEDDDGAQSESDLDSVVEYLIAQGYDAVPVDSKKEGFMEPTHDARTIYGEKYAGDYSTFTFCQL